MVAKKAVMMACRSVDSKAVHLGAHSVEQMESKTVVYLACCLVGPMAGR